MKQTLLAITIGLTLSACGGGSSSSSSTTPATDNTTPATDNTTTPAAKSVAGVWGGFTTYFDDSYSLTLALTSDDGSGFIIREDEMHYSIYTTKFQMDAVSSEEFSGASTQTDWNYAQDGKSFVPSTRAGAITGSTSVKNTQSKFYAVEEFGGNASWSVELDYDQDSRRVPAFAEMTGDYVGDILFAYSEGYMEITSDNKIHYSDSDGCKFSAELEQMTELNLFKFEATVEGCTTTPGTYKGLLTYRTIPATSSSGTDKHAVIYAMSRNDDDSVMSGYLSKQ
ncbi:MAG: hypothetical protein H6998_00105 [Hahellaceae bacterium]|nr:hypothetical protein [Hahellaceae bacterium]